MQTPREKKPVHIIHPSILPRSPHLPTYLPSKPAPMRTPPSYTETVTPHEHTRTYITKQRNATQTEAADQITAKYSPA
jgi:hypothetical protein